MKSFLEIPESTILKMVRSTIHDYGGSLSEDTLFNAGVCLERALERIRTYYREINGIGYLDRPLNCQITELEVVMEHYTPLVQNLVSKTQIRHDKNLTIRHINKAYVNSLFLPSFQEAGFKTTISFHGNNAVIRVRLNTRKWAQFTVIKPTEMNSEQVCELISSVKQIQSLITTFGRNISVI